ncbi:MAG: hypothetical protein EPO28_03505 [Saprospiraceae bacterium]|nr:MAG: hypothetical protein EPO28_03505 [Saprospiraceae bacterium]
MATEPSTDLKLARLNFRGGIIVAVITAFSSVLGTFFAIKPSAGKTLQAASYAAREKGNDAPSCFPGKTGSLFKSAENEPYEFIRENRSDVKHIMVSGVSLYMTTVHIESHFKEMKELDGLEILVVKVNSVAFKYHFSRETNYAIEFQKEKSKSVMKLVSQLKAREEAAQRNIKIGLKELDFPVDEKIVLVELKNGAKVCFVKIYPFRNDTQVHSLYLRFDYAWYPEEYNWYKQKFHQYFMAGTELHLEKT